jgi:hypothetical protein
VATLSKAVTVRFTESEYTSLCVWAAEESKNPTEWLRAMALKNLGKPLVAGEMSQDAIEIRVGVNTIIEVLYRAFPERLNRAWVKKIVKEGWDYVANQGVAGGNGNGAVIGEGEPGNESEA